MTNTGPLPVRWASCRSRCRKAMNPAPVSVPASTENRSAPLALIAEIMFRPNRAPVPVMVGDWPTGAHRGAGVVVAAHAGLVDEEHRATGCLGLRGDLGIFDLSP